MTKTKRRILPLFRRKQYELKYNGSIITVSMDELIILAQKGLNYDKIKAKLEKAKKYEAICQSVYAAIASVDAD